MILDCLIADRLNISEHHGPEKAIVKAVVVPVGHRVAHNAGPREVGGRMPSVQVESRDGVEVSYYRDVTPIEKPEG